MMVSFSQKKIVISGQEYNSVWRLNTVDDRWQARIPILKPSQMNSTIFL